MKLCNVQKLGVCSISVIVLACVLLPVSTVSRADTTPDLNARIQRVENGLLPPLVSKGEAASGMKLRDRLQFYKTPGVSIAVINQGRIEWARAYGTLEAGGNAAVTTSSIFQA